MVIADWSQSQSLPSSLEVLARKWWNFQPLYGCLSFLEDEPRPEDFLGWILWVVSWLHKERKFREFQEAWAMKQDKDQIRIKCMNNKIKVKRGQVKGLETLLILSQPRSHETGTVFVVFLQLLCSVVLCLSTYFNNRGIITTWHINIFSWQKEMKVIFFMLSHWWEMDKIGHEMWIDYLYSGLIIKECLYIFPLVRGRNRRWLARGHRA